MDGIIIEGAGGLLSAAENLQGGKKGDENDDIQEEFTDEELDFNAEFGDGDYESILKQLTSDTSSSRMKALASEFEELMNEDVVRLEIHQGNFRERAFKLLGFLMINNLEDKEVDFFFGRNTLPGKKIFYGWLLKSHKGSFNQFRVMNNNLGNKGAAAIGLALQSDPVVETLDLSRNNITYCGGYLGDGIAASTHLKNLLLNSNKMTIMKNIADALAVNKSLTLLDLTNNSIGPKATQRLVAGLLENQSLTDLLLGDNDIGSEGGESLGQLIAGNSTIQRIELQGNGLKDEGVIPITNALKGNNSIQKIRLGNNEITDVGGEELAQAILENDSIVELFVPGNKLSDCVEHLAESLHENKIIKKVNLSGNSIGDEGAKHLGKMIFSEDNVIEELLLQNNGISNKGALVIAKAINDTASTTLTLLDLSENEIEYVGAKAISDAETDDMRQLSKIRLAKNPIENVNLLKRADSTLSFGDVADIVNINSNKGVFGVVIAESETESCFAKILLAFAVLITWADFITDSLVVRDFFLAEEDAWAGFGLTFLLLPVAFMLIYHTNPPKDSKMPTLTRILYAFMNIFQLRILYETFRSIVGVKKVDKDQLLNDSNEDAENKVVNKTTPQLGSVRLSESVLESGPQAMLQVHVIVYTVLKNLKLDQGTLIIIIISIMISATVLGQTLSDLFEKKGVQRDFPEADSSQLFVRLLPCWVYQSTAFLFRALTVGIFTTLLQWYFMIVLFVIVFGSRMLLWKLTKSDRKIPFIFVVCFITNSSWDKLLAARVGSLLTALEGALAVALLYSADFFSSGTIKTLYNDIEGFDFLDDLSEKASIFAGIMGGLFAIYFPLFTFYVSPLHQYERINEDKIADKEAQLMTFDISDPKLDV